MIYKDGKPVSGGSTSVPEETIKRILESANDDMLDRISGMLGKIRVGGNLPMSAEDEKEDRSAMADLARMMAVGGSVEESNFKSLGQEEIVRPDGNRMKGTMDLLEGINV